jgi:hypothetical protein
MIDFDNLWRFSTVGSLSFKYLNNVASGGVAAKNIAVGKISSSINEIDLIVHHFLYTLRPSSPLNVVPLTDKRGNLCSGR